jgi:hypothetical protein
MAVVDLGGSGNVGHTDVRLDMPSKVGNGLRSANVNDLTTVKLHSHILIFIEHLGA